jgi:hypothetical protein
MAETFSNANETKRITLNASAGLATQVDFSAGARSFLIKFYAADGTTTGIGQFAYTGSDGGAIDSDAWRVEAGEVLSIPLRNKESVEALSSIYVASADSLGIVQILSSEVD